MQAGLKTGMYYLRTRAAADAIKFTVDQQALAKNKAARAAAATAAEPLKVILTMHAAAVDLVDHVEGCGTFHASSMAAAAMCEGGIGTPLKLVLSQECACTS